MCRYWVQETSCGWPNVYELELNVSGKLSIVQELEK